MSKKEKIYRSFCNNAKRNEYQKELVGLENLLKNFPKLFSIIENVNLQKIAGILNIWKGSVLSSEHENLVMRRFFSKRLKLLIAVE